MDLLNFSRKLDPNKVCNLALSVHVNTHTQSSIKFHKIITSNCIKLIGIEWHSNIKDTKICESQTMGEKINPQSFH